MDSNKIKQYYAAEIEKNRLELDFCMLEGIRTHLKLKIKQNQWRTRETQKTQCALFLQILC